MTYATYFRAELLSSAGVLITGLDGASAIGFTDPVSEEGEGHATFNVHDPAVPLLIAGRYVRIWDVEVDNPTDEVEVFTFAIDENPDYQQLSEREEADETITISGPRWDGAIGAQAAVWPDAALDLRLDTSFRLFSFASPTFPNAGAWVNAQELYEYLDGVSYGVRWQLGDDGLQYPSPIGFPFPTSPNVLDTSLVPPDYFNAGDATYWIWPPGEEYSLGYAFFLVDVTIPANGTYTFAISSDNYFTLFLEGIPLLGEWEEIAIWIGWKEVTVFLPAGTLRLGVVVHNPDWPVAVNPGAMIFDLYTLGNGNKPETLIQASDATWICYFSANQWPGWNTGQILTQLVNEAQARTVPSLQVLASLGFTTTQDSGGNPFTNLDPGTAYEYIPSFGVNVGTKYVDVWKQLHDEGWGDWHGRPGAFIFDWWAADNVQTASGVAFTIGTDIVALKRGPTEKYTNSMLGKWAHGYVEYADATEATAFGTGVEDVYDTDAADPTEATRLLRIEVDRRKAAANSPSTLVVIEPQDAAHTPYRGFQPGQTVTIPNRTETGTETQPVLSISADTDDDGHAIWALELNKRWRVPEQQVNELLRTIGGRSFKIGGAIQ